MEVSHAPSQAAPPGAIRAKIPVVIAAFLAYWLLVVAFQTAVGARAEPFGGYADEAAHFMSGLLVRDYVTAGLPGSPLAFASKYYTHMPFLAIGYWPPLFYGIEGFWMMLFGWDRATILLLSAFLAAAVAGTCFRVLTPWLGVPGAFLAGLLLLLTPSFQWSNCLVMTDTTLALFCLWFGLAFAAWVDKPSLGRAILTGVLLAAALFTKLNSIHLPLMVFFFLLFTNRWAILRRPTFWLMPAVTLLLWGPWILRTHSLLGIGFDGLVRPPMATLLGALGRSLLTNLSWLIVPVMAGAVYIWKHERGNTVLVVCILLPLTYTSFLMAAGVMIEDRFLAPILTPSVILAGIGLRRLADWLRPKYLPGPLVIPALAAVCVAGFAATVGFHWHVRLENTISPVVAFLEKRERPEDASVLVPSSAEGPFIAQFATSDPQRPARLLARPIKLLASENWTGTSYRAKYARVDDLVSVFDRFPLRFIIVATHASPQEYEHDAQLRTMLQTHPERWIRVTMPSDTWSLYERIDGRKLTAPAMEALAREVLEHRLQSVMR